MYRSLNRNISHALPVCMVSVSKGGEITTILPLAIPWGFTHATPELSILVNRMDSNHVVENPTAIRVKEITVHIVRSLQMVPCSAPFRIRIPRNDLPPMI